MLKIITGISAFIYAIILFFSIKGGIFGFEVSWWGRMANDYSHGTYLLSFLGYLVLCFPTFYTMIITMLFEVRRDFLVIVYAICMIIHMFMILEIGANGLYVSTIIISAFFYFGISWNNKY